MSLKTLIPFPISAPTPTTTTTTEIRFSRWNNPNAADKFDRHRRTQQHIEDDLRRHRRFESAENIAAGQNSLATSTGTSFKSIGTPSTPSLSSIPAKKSKYRNPNPNYYTPHHDDHHNGIRKLQIKSNEFHNPNPNSNYYPLADDEQPSIPKLQRKSYQNPNPDDTHPAFRKLQKMSKLPKNKTGGEVGEVRMKVGEEGGLSYVVPGAPFEFMYSYTETPKVKPLALRESPIVPFGLPRPWTGRKPFPESKKKLPEFDSFKPPPSNKKGVKPVQKPGPFLPGSGPKYVMSREEVLGEALTGEEVTDLVEGCKKTRRQLNMGRDGLTHNMLDNIHAHWKRRRVCKIKCKGVCTVDMNNVCDQLEEKTGGKIIYRRGGAVYLFRGRNYNHRTRPRFPLMLWKPVTPVYPRLVKRVPEGLTSEEAIIMRKKGRELTPICKLGKNGVYIKLVRHVREAFEACELVRIDCQGLNPSDYRKIGAKLMDLVPCVLMSFEKEHILMWRGRDWKPSILLPQNDGKDVKISDSDIASLIGSDDEEELALTSSNISIHGMSVELPDDESFEGNDIALSISDNPPDDDDDVESSPENLSENLSDEKEPPPTSAPSESLLGVLALLREALENGSAVILDEGSLDADVVYKRSLAFAETAPPGPVFSHWRPPGKVAPVEEAKEEKENPDLKAEEVVEGVVGVVEQKLKEKKPKERKQKSPKVEDFKDDYFLNVVPQGSLKVDELAKLLA